MECFAGGPFSPAPIFSSGVTSCFMFQLLSWKNKKGAAFFVKDNAFSFFI